MLSECNRLYTFASGVVVACMHTYSLKECVFITVLLNCMQDTSMMLDLVAKLPSLTLARPRNLNHLVSK